MEVLNYLLGYENLKIYQDKEMFNFSIDSVLLPNFVTINKTTKKILDIGCGNAPIPLILSTKTNAQIIGVEIQKEVSDLAIKSVKVNNLENHIQIINIDIKEYAEKCETDTFDIITCNPPFFKIKSEEQLSNSKYKKLARHELTLNINDIMFLSKKILKNKGIIAIVHRPERMLEILKTMVQNNIEPKKIQLIYPKTDTEAKIILIEGRKNGKPGLKFLPPIYVHKENGEYTDQVKKYFQ